MDFTGSGLPGTRYKLNRKFTDEECKNQLKQKQRIDIQPSYDLGAIRINNTYLELVDRYYAWRGIIFTTIGVLFVLFLALYFSFCITTLHDFYHPTNVSQSENIGFFVFDNLMLLPMLAFLGWMVLFESFTYTHFPIRLNRKNRKVYVFRPGRPNKPILIADWDKLFFALCPCRKGATDVGRFWDIRGHVLSDDGNTVLDTFAFDMFWDETDMDALRSHWEFIRRYMEEPDGAQQAYKLVEVCLPIADRRESFRFGLNRFFINFLGGRWLLYLLFPLWFLFVIGRWIANRTCRIPVWPKEIEDQCCIEVGDPYVKDASMNPADTYQW